MNQNKTSILFTGLNQTNFDSMNILAKCQALAADLDCIDHIFFYFDVVRIAKQTDCYEQWQAFKQQHGIELIACSTVASRRHVAESEQSPFELAGLSEFYSRLHHCDNLVQI